MQRVEETQWYGGWRFFALDGRRGCAERVPALVHKYQCTHGGDGVANHGCERPLSRDDGHSFGFDLV